MNNQTTRDAFKLHVFLFSRISMILRQCITAGFALFTTLLTANFVLGQDYPSKPVRIVTGGAGGGTDLNSRLVAEGLASAFGQPAIVDNRAGAVGPGGIVYRSPPDGYTLALDGSSFWIGKLLGEMPYDPVRDYSPVSIVSGSPSVLAVHLTLAVNSVQELIALAKSKPRALNYSVGNAGSAQWLAAELFRIMTGTDMVRISYKGGNTAVNGLLVGDVQISFVGAGSMTPLLKSGKVRALAVTSAKPTPLFPGLPTIADSGFPGFEAMTYFGLFVPAKTPAAIINRLNAEVVRIVNRADVKERLFNAGIGAVGSSPKELENLVKNDLAKWSKVIKDAGIRAE